VGSSCRRFREEGHAPVWWKPVKNLQAPPNENSSPVRGDSGCPIIAFWIVATDSLSQRDLAV
jgi:hypothetical protein